MTIAIIGAGAAGAACVSVLRSRGTDFSVFEKSRGVGGRLATRRVSGCFPDGDLYYDHGAPRFAISQLLQSKISSHLEASTLLRLRDEEYLSSPTMPQLVKDLLRESKVFTNVEISFIEGDSNSWYLHEKNKDSIQSEKSHGPFSKILISAPAPQAYSILRNIECSWKSKLPLIHYNPCWVLMITLNQEVKIKTQKSDIFQNCFYLQHERVGRSSYPNTFSWVAHANPTWSQLHLEENADEIHSKLRGEFLDYFSIGEQNVVHSVAHRWRYSTVVKPLGCSHLADLDLGLYYAGDGCLGNGVAGALESGLHAGELLVGS